MGFFCQSTASDCWLSHYQVNLSVLLANMDTWEPRRISEWQKPDICYYVTVLIIFIYQNKKAQLSLTNAV